MALNDDKKKLQDPAYAAGASVRRALSGGTTYDAMGRSYMARGQAVSQVAAPVRGFTKGLVGAAPDAPAAPAVAAPQVKFAGTDAMPDSMFKSPIQAPPQRQSPSQRMTDDQANAAEVNARTATQPSSPQPGMGVPAGAGGAAPGGIVKSKDKSGNSVYTGTGAYATTDPAISGRAGTIGSVQNQNFGNAVVPQAQASIAQPRVASTFGMGVNDSRLNDQTPAIASPNAAARGFGLAGVDTMSRYNANNEDREATKKLLGDIDTQMFMARGKNTPSARRLVEGLADAQAKLIGNQAANTTAQANENTRGQFGLANTGMEQAGQTTRQRMAGDVTSQGQFLDYDAKNRATDAGLIEKPQYVTDAQGRYLRVGGDGAAPVTDASGAAIQMPPPAQAQQRDYGAEKQMEAYTDILNGMRDMNGQLPPDAAAQAAALLAQAPGAQQGGQAQAAKVTSKADLDKLPKGARYLAPDGQVYIKN